MSDIASATVGYMGSFITEFSDLWMIPVGVCAVGLVLTVVVNALRNKG